MNIQAGCRVAFKKALRDEDNIYFARKIEGIHVELVDRWGRLRYRQAQLSCLKHLGTDHNTCHCNDEE